MGHPGLDWLFRCRKRCYNELSILGCLQILQRTFKNDLMTSTTHAVVLYVQCFCNYAARYSLKSHKFYVISVTLL